MTTRWLDQAIISCELHYCLVLSQKEYEAAVAQVEDPKGWWGFWLKDEHTGANCHWAKDKKGANHCIVSLKADGLSGIQIAGMLCHEAVHIFQEHCRIMGEDTPSDEFQAWSIQHITEQLLKEYAKRMR